MHVGKVYYYILIAISPSACVLAIMKFSHLHVKQYDADVAAASICQLCKTVGSKKLQNRYTMALETSAAM